MTRAYSEDLRRRVIGAVESGADPLGGALAGDGAARPQGGDRRSHRIEAHAALILRAVDEKGGHHPGRTRRACACRDPH